ncbi:antitoxin [Mycobacterium sp. NPDC003449]
MGILDKVKDWLGNNPDKASSAIDKAGDLVDKKTGGKYAGHVDKVQDAAKGQFNKGNAGNDNPQEGTPPAPPAPPQQ